NALHHFTQKEAFIRESARVLRPGGTLAVIGMDPHGRHDSWYIYDYFHGTHEVDLERFPAVLQIRAWMSDAGYSAIHDCVIERIQDHHQGRDVLNHSVLQKNGTSQLILLSDEAYSAGLAKLKADLQEAEDQGKTLVFLEDIALVMTTGQR